jgi:hypothetical protein
MERSSVGTGEQVTNDTANFFNQVWRFGGWREALLEGGSKDRVLPIVICEEGTTGTREENPFVVVEVEYKMMGYYKRFKSKQEYEEYDRGRKHLRNYCKEIDGNDKSGKET